MEYYVTLLVNNKDKVLSRHSSLDEAMNAGKSAHLTSKRGETISVVSGKIGEDGAIEGRYNLYHSWH